MNPIRTAILISGRGSNLSSLIQAQTDPHWPARISVVISNNKQAAGLKIAQENQIKTAVFDNSCYRHQRALQEQHLHEFLTQERIQLIVLAGYMRILSADFVHKWQQRIINIHPSLLPKYPGLHTHERALAAGESEHGCTVHWVTAQLDAGPIIAQAIVPVLKDDTPHTLAARVLMKEHVIYAQAWQNTARLIQQD